MAKQQQLWAAHLRNARSSTEQLATLRNLKNEIIGHPVKKGAVVSSGVLDPITRLTLRPVNRHDGKSHDHTFASKALSEEEMVRLQGLHVLASIALGPYFLPHLQSVQALPAILSNLCPSNNPSQLVLASLRALSNLAESCTLVPSASPLNTGILAENLFSRQYLNTLCRILSQTSSSSLVQSQITIAASLISRLCQEERHQDNLAKYGVLDALATKLAGYIAADGFILPGAEMLAQRDGLQEYLPVVPTSMAGLPLVLDAIAVIIAESKLRASQLLYSPSILAIFPISSATDFFVANSSTRAAWNTFSAAGFGIRPNQLNALDFLLPCIPLHQSRNATGQAAAFPPLGTSSSSLNLADTGRRNGTLMPSWTESSTLDASMISAEEESESPLIAYLIVLLRSKGGIERLSAATVLTILYRAGLTSKTRETAIGLLVVPPLVEMLDENSYSSSHQDIMADPNITSTQCAIRARAPAVLATLITDSEYLQKAAFDADVIKKLSKMLKMAYDPVHENSDAHLWSPSDSEDQIADSQDFGPQFDSRRQSALLSHKIHLRESTLKAVAALVPFKDEYRKSIVEQGMIPYIVESMSANPGKPSSKILEKSDKAKVDRDSTKDGYGTNPISVIIAACGAIRALSRSVSILRTTLIDNGVAMPVFNLLKHTDVEVQIAATATVCNLLTDVSPMREVITEAGVIKILCMHAHANNSKLRLNALWALKHLVHSVSNDIKRLCLEELGQGWLIQLIRDDSEDEGLGSPVERSERTSNSKLGDENDEDIDMDHFEDANESFPSGSFSRPASRPSSSRSKSLQLAEARLSVLRDAEASPARKARREDIAVQEQGLDFIRNLIGGAGPGGTKDTTEMIDFLFNELGQDRVFEILASKLRPKVVNAFHRRRSSSTDTKVIPPQTEIITAVGYILVHIAASEPRHRQLVIAQTELLKLLVDQFNNSSIEVRLALCWLVTNLTWMDDANDGQACSQRANELKKLGFLTKLEMLESDPELNVRERAKSALWQMKQGS